MKSSTTRVLATCVAVAAALFVSSCGSQSDSASQGSSSSTVAGPQPAAFNADDVAFATNMAPHHEQAVELSNLVPERSKNPDVIALAAKIAAAQEPQIQTLRVFLVQWGSEDPDGGGGHEGHANMPMTGMVDAATMARLATLNGQEFDTLWLQSMIGHHEGAIEMANTEIAKGANVDAKSLATQIVTEQQAEITQMKQMLGG